MFLAQLAYPFCQQNLDKAFATVLKNALVVFDHDFANKVQNQDICEVADFVAITAVKDAINLSKKSFNKNLVGDIFACQYKISVAKCLSQQDENFVGVNALTFALQSKYPEYSCGDLACAVADVLAKIYLEIVQSNPLLTIDKDKYLHQSIAKKHFGVDVDPQYDWSVNNDAYQQNLDFFKQNLNLILKINNLCKALTKQKIEHARTFAACYNLKSNHSNVIRNLLNINQNSFHLILYLGHMKSLN